MKLLFISNIAGDGSFSKASAYAAAEFGYEFHYAANLQNLTDEAKSCYHSEMNAKLHHVDFIRNPLNPRNIIALRQLVRLIIKEDFDVVHCNTPVGGMLGRIACWRCHTKKVIYEAHGFHFYSGSFSLTSLVAYAYERLFALVTDAIITINLEDYKSAKSFRLRGKGNVYLVPGVGIDTSKFAPSRSIRRVVRDELSIDDGLLVLISAGDLIKRKNYPMALKALAGIQKQNWRYLICGSGPEEGNLRRLCSQLDIEDKVMFLGRRSDVSRLMTASDIFLFTTRQEGLPRSLMEAMSTGLSCIATRIRGNYDLIEDGISGFLVDIDDISQLGRTLDLVLGSEELRERMGKEARKKIEYYSIDAVRDSMLDVYKHELI